MVTKLCRQLQVVNEAMQSAGISNGSVVQLEH